MWISPSVDSVTARTAAGSPGRTVVACHCGSVTVDEMTYPGTVMMKDAKGTVSSCCSQYDDHWGVFPPGWLHGLRPAAAAKLIGFGPAP